MVVLVGVLFAIAVTAVTARRLLTVDTTFDSRAAQNNSCAATFGSVGSKCNEQCFVNDDCDGGLTCYKPSPTNESGLCRRADNLKNAKCAAPLPSPTGSTKK